MMTREKIHNQLVNHGLSDEQYRKVRPVIVETNLRNTIVVSFVTCLYFLMVGVLGITGFGPWDHRVYFFGAILVFVLFLISLLVVRKDNRWLKVTVYGIVVVIMGVGILAGTYLDTTHNAVSFICFLILAPLVFSDRPYRIITLISILVAVFIFLDVQIKTDWTIIKLDIFNVCLFGFLSAATTIYLGALKVNRFYGEYQASRMLNMDLLTEVMNRSYFERKMKENSILPRESLSLFYIDANGLHEMNNRYGHAEGDKFLKTVAQVIAKYLGEENTYRMGGDEFIGLAADLSTPESMKDRIKNEIEMLDYHVAIGVYTMHQPGIQIDVLHNEAEKQMFQDKEQYYLNKGTTARSTLKE